MLIIILICFLISNSDGKLSLKTKDQLKLLRERFILNNELEPNAKNIFDQNWVNKTSDPFLFNWLEYNKFDLDLTEASLKKSLDWRRLNNIDKVLDWTPPAQFLKDYRVFLTGYTKDGDAVYYAPIGKWDGRLPLRSGKRRDLFKFVIYVVERVIRDLEINNEIRRNNSLEEGGNFVMYGNVEGVTLAQVLSINVLGFIASALGALQANYPFLHKIGIAANAPGIVTTLVEVAKSVLSSETFDRLFVYSESDTKWKNQIFAYAPKEAIPTFWGGEAIIK